MAISEAQRKAVRKYKETNYDRLEISVSKGRKKLLQAHAATNNESLNSFVNRAIEETIRRDNEAAATDAPDEEMGHRTEWIERLGEAVRLSLDEELPDIPEAVERDKPIAPVAVMDVEQDDTNHSQLDAIHRFREEIRDSSDGLVPEFERMGSKLQ